MQVLICDCCKNIIENSNEGIISDGLERHKFDLCDDCFPNFNFYKQIFTEELTELNNNYRKMLENQENQFNNKYKKLREELFDNIKLKDNSNKS